MQARESDPRVSWTKFQCSGHYGYGTGAVAGPVNHAPRPASMFTCTTNSATSAPQQENRDAKGQPNMTSRAYTRVQMFQTIMKRTLAV